MKRLFLAISLFTLPFLFGLSPVLAVSKIPAAGNAGLGCEITGANADVVSLGCLAYIVKNIVDVALMFLGAAALILFLWGSAQMILSRGDPKALQKARGTITFALFGAAVVLGAFLIISFVTNTLGLPDILRNFTFYQP